MEWNILLCWLVKNSSNNNEKLYVSVLKFLTDLASYSTDGTACRTVSESCLDQACSRCEKRCSLWGSQSPEGKAFVLKN